MKKVNYFLVLMTSLLVVLFVELFLLVKLRIVTTHQVTNIKNLIPKVLIVESGSMEPAIKTGSLVFSQIAETYKNGDIITYRLTPGGKTLVTHRIIYTDSSEFLTKGDANKTLDMGRIKSDQIVGKVFLKIPYVGYLGNFAKTPTGFILLVIIPATIIIYEELLFVKKEILLLLSKYKRPKLLTNKLRVPKTALLIPVFGLLIAVAGITGSYFTDSERSINNKMQAAEFTQPTTAPTVAPTPSPSPTPTEVPIATEVPIPTSN